MISNFMCNYQLSLIYCSTRRLCLKASLALDTWVTLPLMISWSNTRINATLTPLQRNRSLLNRRLSLPHRVSYCYDTDVIKNSRMITMGQEIK